MITAKQLCEQVKIPLDNEWGYIWGTYGQMWTAKSKITSRAPASSKENAAKYGHKWVGHYVTDCSGLLYWAFKELGGYVPHGANSIWSKYTTNKGKLTPGFEPKPGSAVFLVSGSNRHHVGLYVGGGWCIEAKGTYYGVVVSELSHWDEWGELKGVDYTDAEGIIIDFKTADASPRNTLRVGDSSSQVAVMQNLLRKYGYSIDADGVFGSKTKAALIKFQQATGLTADGVCGPITWAALEGESSAESDGTVTAENTAVARLVAELKDKIAELEEALKTA